MSYLSQLDLCFDFPQLVLGFWKKHTSFPFHSVSYDNESVDKLSLREIDMFSTYLPKRAFAIVLSEEESHQRGTASPGEELGISEETTSYPCSL